MNEIDYLRQKKLEQMQQQAQFQQQVAELEELAKKKLTKEALERYGTVRSAHPELAFHAARVILQIKNPQVTDEQLKTILQHLSGKKRDIKITQK